MAAAVSAPWSPVFSAKGRTLVPTGHLLPSGNGWVLCRPHCRQGGRAQELAVAVQSPVWQALSWLHTFSPFIFSSDWFSCFNTFPGPVFDPGDEFSCSLGLFWSCWVGKGWQKQHPPRQAYWGGGDSLQSLEQQLAALGSEQQAEW